MEPGSSGSAPNLSHVYWTLPAKDHRIFRFPNNAMLLSNSRAARMPPACLSPCGSSVPCDLQHPFSTAQVGGTRALQSIRPKPCLRRVLDANNRYPATLIADLPGWTGQVAQHSRAPTPVHHLGTLPQSPSQPAHLVRHTRTAGPLVSTAGAAEAAAALPP